MLLKITVLLTVSYRKHVLGACVTRRKNLTQNPSKFTIASVRKRSIKLRNIKNNYLTYYLTMWSERETFDNYWQKNGDGPQRDNYCRDESHFGPCKWALKATAHFYKPPRLDTFSARTGVEVKPREMRTLSEKQRKKRTRRAVMPRKRHLILNIASCRTDLEIRFESRF